NTALPRSFVVASPSLTQDYDGFQHRISAGARPTFFLAPEIEHLVGFAHFTLAQFALAQVDVRVCRGCGRPFPPARENQEYHDTSCATRARQARHRAKSRPESV